MFTLQAVTYLVEIYSALHNWEQSIAKIMVDFEEFMNNQTVGVGPNGCELFYLTDVKAFLHNANERNAYR